MKTIFKYLCMLISTSLLSSCYDKFLPDDIDALGEDARFLVDTYTPTLGRNTLMNNNFSAGNASQPISFKIVNMRKFNGDPAPELTETYPVTVWKQPYLGNEKSLKEIEDKRGIAYYPLFNVRQHNGNFEMWAETNSSFIRTAPDSAYLFDVEVSNNGGKKYFRKLRLVPRKERPFEPTIYNEITGNANRVFVNPTSVSNVKGARTSRVLGTGDIEVYFRKVVDDNGNDIGSGNSLKFIFKDSANYNIDPNLFKLTDWENLVHGFNMEKTQEYVKYDVAYPIPLIDYRTAYTNQTGNRARARFSYDRLGFGNVREVANIFFDFAIYEKGDWEIIFRFAGESPKFENE
jgi:hypothetical protein